MVRTGLALFALSLISFHLLAQSPTTADALAKLQAAKEAEASRLAALEAAKRALAEAKQEKAARLAATIKALTEEYGEASTTPAIKPVGRLTLPSETIRDIDPAALETARSAVAVLIVTDKAGKVGTGAATLVAQDRLVTCHHVVGNQRKVKVRFRASAEQDAEVIFLEADQDLALLKVDSGKRLPLAMNGTPTVGERVYCIGSPFNFSDTVTSGIVSALDREITWTGGPVLKGMLQTDSSINPGSSGGVMVNARGEVLGIMSAVHEAGKGIGWVNPAANVKALLIWAAGQKGKSSSLAPAPSLVVPAAWWQAPARELLPMPKEVLPVPELLPMPKEWVAPAPAPKPAPPRQYASLRVRTPMAVRWIHVDGIAYEGPGGGWTLRIEVDADRERTVTLVAGGVSRRVTLRAGQMTVEDLSR